MRGNGMYGGGCHPRACTRQNSVNRVKKNGNLDNIVIIDLDGDSDVIILDIPESVQEKLLGPCAHRKGSKVPPHHKIIKIDDDGDEADGDNDANHVRTSKTGSKKLRSDRTSTKSSSSVEGLANPARPSTTGEENVTSKVSNGEKPCTSKLPSKNRYGLIDSESSLSDSDSDSSDSELLEGSSGTLREQWEKAFLRRKHDLINDRSARGNQKGTSGLHAGAHTSVPVDNRDDLYKREHVSSGHRFNDQSCEENLASTSGFHDRESADARRQNKEAFFNGDSAHSWSTYGKYKSSDSCNVQINKVARKGKGATRVNCCSSDKSNSAANLTEEFGRVNPYPWYNMGRRDKWSSDMPACSKAEQQRDVEDPSSDILQAVSINDEDRACSGSQDSVSPDILDERVVQANNSVSSEEVLCHGSSNKLHHEGDSGLNQEAIGTPLDISRDSGSTNNGNVTVCVKDVTLESASSGPSEEVHVEACSLEKADVCLRKPLCENISSFVKSAPNIHSDQPEQPNAKNGDCMPIMQDSIINGREKMKDTDEYRKAQEEEWASRQRQLEIQAEEAQKLRKRKKAEVLRLLDMERRQKQRVEEVRQTQKKDEENINMKEQLRSEFGKELYRLEMTSFDMASLLRGLGIQVGGRPPYSSQEVRAAYKRALLMFHPDRASRTDVRKQVEAEEKFKLICRMKEKLKI